MISKRHIFEIHRLADQGLSEREIALRLGHCPRTVKKYLANPETRHRRSKRRFKKLEPYFGSIDQLLAEWPNASGAVIFQRLHEKGY